MSEPKEAVETLDEISQTFRKLGKTPYDEKAQQLRLVIEGIRARKAKVAKFVPTDIGKHISNKVVSTTSKNLVRYPEMLPVVAGIAAVTGPVPGVSETAIMGYSTARRALSSSGYRNKLIGQVTNLIKKKIM